MSEATPRPWSWWTSNNWRRLSSDVTGRDGDIICPTVSRSDGHPDLIVREADMELIVRAVNCFDELVATLMEARLYVADAGGEVSGMPLCLRVFILIRDIDAILARARGETP